MMFDSPELAYKQGLGATRYATCPYVYECLQRAWLAGYRKAWPLLSWFDEARNDN